MEEMSKRRNSQGKGSGGRIVGQTDPRRAGWQEVARGWLNPGSFISLHPLDPSMEP